MDGEEHMALRVFLAYYTGISDRDIAYNTLYNLKFHHVEFYYTNSI